MSVALRHVHIKFHLLWELGVSSGLRISDLLTLRGSHIKPSGFHIVEQKTKNVRHIRLSLELFCYFKGFMALYAIGPDDFLFFSHEGRKYKPMSRQWAHRVIARTASKFALVAIGPHSMRKIYACRLYASTTSIEAVRRDLGHKKLETTLLYLQDLLISSTLQSE